MDGDIGGAAIGVVFAVVLVFFDVRLHSINLASWCRCQNNNFFNTLRSQSCRTLRNVKVVIENGFVSVISAATGVGSFAGNARKRLRRGYAPNSCLR